MPFENVKDNKNNNNKVNSLDFFVGNCEELIHKVIVHGGGVDGLAACSAGANA